MSKEPMWKRLAAQRTARRELVSVQQSVIHERVQPYFFLLVPLIAYVCFRYWASTVAMIR